MQFSIKHFLKCSIKICERVFVNAMAKKKFFLSID